MQALVFRASGGLGHFGLGQSWTKNSKNQKKVSFHLFETLNCVFTFAVATSVGSNPVHGLGVWDFWRVRVGLKFGFGWQTWVQKSSNFNL